MTTDDPRIVGQVAEQLGNYVYVLVDPRDSIPFYVGKGIGGRMLQHGIDAAQLSAPGCEENDETSRKIARIKDIRATGVGEVKTSAAFLVSIGVSSRRSLTCSQRRL